MHLLIIKVCLGYEVNYVIIQRHVHAYNLIDTVTPLHVKYINILKKVIDTLMHLY